MLAVLGAALLAYVVWSAWHQANPEVRTGLLGFRVLDDRRVEVRFEAAADPGTGLRCSVRARNADHQVIGSAEVSVGPGTQARREAVAVVPTRERAVDASVASCVRAG